MMEKRKLGTSGLTIAPLAFGGNVFGWTADETTSMSLIDAFLDAGFDFIDTADVYSIWAPGHTGGESEIMIGKWIARSGRRGSLKIATKVGMDMKAGGKGLSKAHILKSVETSLRRLQTDYIDLYQSHQDDKDTPLEETLRTYDDLIKAGKVRAIGASNYTAPRLVEALKLSVSAGLPRYATLQPHYNLIKRSDFEGELQDLCLREGLGVIPYWSLAAGLLTGKYASPADFAGKARGQTLETYGDARGFAIVKVLGDVAARLGATSAQVALAWLLAQPGVTAPIVSATSLTQLADILKAVEVKLDTEALAVLKAAGA
jgi:aryl-alcohol dehydrogenase-like predicted oxidoreductase